jgi:hypothetical protein
MLSESHTQVDIEMSHDSNGSVISSIDLGSLTAPSNCWELSWNFVDLSDSPSALVGLESEQLFITKFSGISSIALSTVLGEHWTLGVPSGHTCSTVYAHPWLRLKHLLLTPRD